MFSEEKSPEYERYLSAFLANCRPSDQILIDPIELAKKRENGLRELESLKQMAVNWKEKDYGPRVKSGDMSAIADFEEELESQIGCYLDRLYVTGYVTLQEMKEAFAVCFDQIIELKLWVKENKESEDNSIVGWLKSIGFNWIA